MGTEKKEGLPKEETSEDSKPHGQTVEKLAQEVCHGHEFGEASEEDMSEGHLRESSKEIIEKKVSSGETLCIWVTYLQEVVLR